MTWKTLIRRTLEDIGVYGQAQIPNANDDASALDRLNDWIDWLKTQKLALYTTARTTWPLTTASSYTVGTGGVVNVARPPGAEFISALSYVNTATDPDFEYPLGDPITDQQWQGIPFKALQAQMPGGFYYEPSFPLATLSPFPIPTASNLLGVLYSGVPTEEVTNINDTIALPPGYRLFIRLGLNIELCDAFKVSVKVGVAQRYEMAMASIKRPDETSEEISFGVAGRLFSGSGGGQSNIYTGE